MQERTGRKQRAGCGLTWTPVLYLPGTPVHAQRRQPIVLEVRYIRRRESLSVKNKIYLTIAILATRWYVLCKDFNISNISNTAIKIKIENVDGHPSFLF